MKHISWILNFLAISNIGVSKCADEIGPNGLSSIRTPLESFIELDTLREKFIIDKISAKKTTKRSPPELAFKAFSHLRYELVCAEFPIL